MTSPWVIAAQILVLLGLLVALLNVQGSIGSGTSAIVESLASEDINVQSQEETMEAGQTDDGASDDDPDGSNGDD